MKEKLIKAFYKNIKSVKNCDHIWFSGGCTVSGEICMTLHNIASIYSISYNHIHDEITRDEYLNMFNLASDLKKELEAKRDIELEEKSKKELDEYLDKPEKEELTPFNDMTGKARSDFGNGVLMRLLLKNHRVNDKNTINR